MTYQESFFFGNSNAVKETRELPFKREEMDRAVRSGIYLGTSSWKFRGWEGMVYSKTYSSQLEFEKNCLREYGELFPTVSLDATYYDWPREAYMRKLLDQVPDSFRFCMKATSELTMPRFPAHPRFGNLAGKENPGYLNVEEFLNRYWQPLEFMQDKIAAIIFEFSRGSLIPEDRFKTFLAKVPSEIPVYVEFRDPELWSEEFLELFTESNVQIVLHAYSKMPGLAWQFKRMQAAGFECAQPLLVRALLPSHREKATSMEQMQPYDHLIELQDEYLCDLVSLAQAARQAERKAFFLIGNCLEGSAPLSVGRFLQKYQPARRSPLVQ